MQKGPHCWLTIIRVVSSSHPLPFDARHFSRSDPIKLEQSPTRITAIAEPGLSDKVRLQIQQHFNVLLQLARLINWTAGDFACWPMLSEM